MEWNLDIVLSIKYVGMFTALRGSGYR